MSAASVAGPSGPASASSGGSGCSSDSASPSSDCQSSSSPGEQQPSEANGSAQLQQLQTQNQQHQHQQQLDQQQLDQQLFGVPASSQALCTLQQHQRNLQLQHANGGGSGGASSNTNSSSQSSSSSDGSSGGGGSHRHHNHHHHHHNHNNHHHSHPHHHHHHHTSSNTNSNNNNNHHHHHHHSNHNHHSPGPSSHSSSSSSAASSSNVTAFLSKLWRMVNDYSNSDLIRWSQSGCSFVIVNQIQFAKDLLPLYFKHSNMASFIRQLNMYGFRKIPVMGNSVGGASGASGSGSPDETSEPNGHHLALEKHQQQRSGSPLSVSEAAMSQAGGQVRTDIARFYHVNFMRGQEQRLASIKRKSNMSASHNLVVNGSFCEEVRAMINDVKSIRDGQTSSESILGAIQVDNKSLWRDVAVLRNQHMKQRRVIEKLIQFLLSLIQTRGNMIKRRKMKFFLTPNDLNGSGGGAQTSSGTAPNANSYAPNGSQHDAANNSSVQMDVQQTSQLNSQLCQSAENGHAAEQAIDRKPSLTTLSTRNQSFSSSNFAPPTYNSTASTIQQQQNFNGGGPSSGSRNNNEQSPFESLCQSAVYAADQLAISEDELVPNGGTAASAVAAAAAAAAATARATPATSGCATPGSGHVTPATSSNGRLVQLTAGANLPAVTSARSCPRPSSLLTANTANQPLQPHLDQQQQQHFQYINNSSDSHCGSPINFVRQQQQHQQQQQQLVIANNSQRQQQRNAVLGQENINVQQHEQQQQHQRHFNSTTYPSVISFQANTATLTNQGLQELNSGQQQQQHLRQHHHHHQQQQHYQQLQPPDHQMQVQQQQLCQGQQQMQVVQATASANQSAQLASRLALVSTTVATTPIASFTTSGNMRPSACNYVSQWTANSVYNTMAQPDLQSFSASSPGSGNVFGDFRHVMPTFSSVLDHHHHHHHHNQAATSSSGRSLAGGASGDTTMTISPNIVQANTTTTPSSGSNGGSSRATGQQQATSGRSAAPASRPASSNGGGPRDY